MSRSPEAVVQRQLEAYNAHDIDAFLATYNPNVQILNFPAGNIILEGHEAMRADYESFLREDKPHVEILTRIVTGNKVIDHERVTDLKRPAFEAVAIYEIVDGLIQRVWFVRG